MKSRRTPSKLATYVVDTHALLFYLADSPKLGKQVDAVLSSPDNSLILPAIALAEALWITATRELGVTPTEVLMAIDADPRFTIYDLTREVVQTAHGLEKVSEMHDRQIVATTLLASSKTEKAVLLTRDANIISSGEVSTLW